MKSGGMKFWLQKGAVVLGLPTCVACLAMNQINADESSGSVRFKLSDDGDSGKVIVVERKPEKRDAARVFDNGLRFKRDKDGNIYRIGDFKEIAPLKSPTNPPGNSETPASTVAEEKPIQEISDQAENEQTSNALLPSLPSIDSIFPKMDWSGFEEAFDIFATESSGTTNKKSAAPGLKIKPSQAASRVETKAEPESEQQPQDEKERVVPEVDSTEEVAAADEPSEPMQETEIQVDAAVEASPSDAELEAADDAPEVEPRPVDSVTGMPMLKDLIASDFPLPEIALPKLDLNEIKLFFGTSAEPLVQQENTEANADEVNAVDKSPEDEKAEVAQVNEPNEKQQSQVVHRVPGRKSIGGTANRSAKPTTNSAGTSFNILSEFKIPEFKIPEFSNPFASGNKEQSSAEEVTAKPIKIPGLKKPVVPSPDSEILESLPKLDSERAEVPGLKLMPSQTPKKVPMTDEEAAINAAEIAKAIDEKSELGSGLPVAPQADDEKEALVDPDKILDEFKK